MRFLDFLKRRTAGDQDDAPPLDRPVSVPAADPDGDGPASGAGGAALEPIFTAIEYRDAKGEFSRRRITILAIEDGPHAPLLKAVCHERRAQRSFRVDRIQLFIDPESGEIIETAAFFERILGVCLAAPKPEASETDWVSRVHIPEAFQALRDALHAPLSVLVAVAKSDGLDPREVASIMAYVGTEATCPEAPCVGIRPGAEEIARVEPILRRMRPRRASLERHLALIAELPERRKIRFAEALRDVILADGEITEEEVALFEAIDRWFSGAEAA